MTNKEYEQMDAAINAELDAQEALDEAEIAAMPEIVYRNAYGLTGEDVATLREWGIL